MTDTPLETALLKIWPVNPFLGFDSEALTQRGVIVDLQGWIGESSLFTDLIDRTRPRVIIEVGTWKGLSCTVMAEHIKRSGLDCKIICVDTWLGGIEHWLHERFDFRRYMRHGHPFQLYQQFLYNIAKLELTDYVLPMPQTSGNAAHILNVSGVRADLIYIDASHRFDDVTMDLLSYWDLLRAGGVLFGDDFQMNEVRAAVEQFCAAKGLEFTVSADGFNYIIPKGRQESQPAGA